MERIQAVLKLQRLVPATFAHYLLEIRAESWRDIGRDGDAADASHCVEAQRHVVIAAELQEILAASEALRRDPREVPSGILDSDDLGVLCDPREGFDRYVGDGPRGHVVDDNRQWRLFGQCFEMRGEAGLARLVVIRDDDQR